VEVVSIENRAVKGYVMILDTYDTPHNSCVDIKYEWYLQHDPRLDIPVLRCLPVVLMPAGLTRSPVFIDAAQVSRVRSVVHLLKHDSHALTPGPVVLAWSADIAWSFLLVGTA
jgi:hypothetical protein